jgi:nucleolar pre-ribosomal-associated protein 1
MLTLRYSVSEEDAKRKPAMRTLTVRYILTHLKYQPEGGKIDILKQRPLCGSLFQYVREDPADLVVELLRTTEQNVFKDKTLPRSSKAALLTQQHLERVTEIATRLDTDEGVAKVALEWLKAVSTNSFYGVLRASGWYPPGTTKAEHNLSKSDGMIDLGIDSLEFYEDAGSSPVRNTTLLSWILTLRPQSDAREREIVLTCFKSAPELVHAYFREKGFQLDPKLTNTWIGYASFVFEVIGLAVPAKLGHIEEGGFADVPPQTSVVMDSIIPKPLSQKVLTRCLNQSNGLITFFALRLMVIAFQKLAKVQVQFEQAASTSAHSKLWKEASVRLQNRFIEQCPKMKDVINTFRQTPDDQEHILQREAVTRLLSLYYEIVPAQALEEQFDISGALTASLVREESPVSEAPELNALRSLELEHLLSVARHSAGMRWFHTQGGLKFSPFVTLLRLHSKHTSNMHIRTLLSDVLCEHGLINSTTPEALTSPIDALVASVILGGDQNESVYTFLDDCLSRGSRQPVKYLDSLEEQKAKLSSDSATPSLLIEVVREQTPFAAEKLTGTDRTTVMTWINDLLSLFAITHDSGLLLGTIAAEVAKKGAGQNSRPSVDMTKVLAGLRASVSLDAEPAADGPVPNEKQPGSLPFSAVPIESPNHPEIFRWQQKDLDLAIEDGDLDALILCLCSEHTDIRHQARVQLSNMIAKVQASDLDIKDQLHILLGELLETYEQHLSERPGKPLPYLVGTFATRTLHVLADPTHFMYPKINRYLMRSPQWRTGRLPGYWMENTILSQPEQDDAYWNEVQWVADWLVDGLRTASDLDMLRRSSAFERVMGLYSSSAASDKLVRNKVLELVFRAAHVDANTLVTRTGCLKWLETIGGSGVQKQLKEFVLEKADKTRLKEWAAVDVDGVAVQIDCIIRM